jgi:hypothetical protein
MREASYSSSVTAWDPGFWSLACGRTLSLALVKTNVGRARQPRQSQPTRGKPDHMGVAL